MSQPTFYPPGQAPPAAPVVVTAPAPEPAARRSGVTGAHVLLAACAAAAPVAWLEYRGVGKGRATPPPAAVAAEKPGALVPEPPARPAPDGPAPQTDRPDAAPDFGAELRALRGAVAGLSKKVDALAADRPEPAAAGITPADLDKAESRIAAMIRGDLRAVGKRLDALGADLTAAVSAKPAGPPAKPEPPAPVTVLTNDPPGPDGEPPDGMTPQDREAAEDLADKFLNRQIEFGADLRAAAARRLSPRAARAVRAAVVENTEPGGRMDRKRVADAIRKVKLPARP